MQPGERFPDYGGHDDGQAGYFGDLMESVAAMENHREGKLTAQLQGRGGATPQGGFKVLAGHSEEVALLQSGVRPETADQRKNAGKMGRGPYETESSGGRSRSSCPQVP
jgi:hypothetical protein